MAIKLAINGFGRIGRNVLRAIVENDRSDVEVVAINDLGPVETNAHLLRYDSVHGRFPAKVTVQGDTIDVGRGPIRVTAERDPKALPWKDVDVALECTGIFTARDKAALHLENGSKRVLVSAPASGADKTIVFGVNDNALTKDDLVVSNASCTTNCLAPVAYVLNKAFGIRRGFMTTIHSYTGDQPTLDTMHKDLYRARAAAMNQIPTSTGAAKAVGLVLPELNGKLDGVSIRVPTPNVSVVDLTFEAGRDVTAEEINDAIRAAATGELKGILGYTDDLLVSMDFNHDPHSSIFATPETKVMDGNFCRILSWYDNEWGFSNRMADTAVALAKHIWKVTPAAAVVARREADGDAGANRSLAEAAFASAPRASGTEAAIVDGLRRAGALSLWLVAADPADGTVRDRVAVSPVAIGQGSPGWFGPGPVALQPSRRREGIGTAHNSSGPGRLRAEDAAGVVLLGERLCHARFGYRPDPRLSFARAASPCLRRLTLRGDDPAGAVARHPAFDGSRPGCAPRHSRHERPHHVRLPYERPGPAA